jgi:hypothetical protein
MVRLAFRNIGRDEGLRTLVRSRTTASNGYKVRLRLSGPREKGREKTTEDDGDSISRRAEIFLYFRCQPQSPGMCGVVER